MTRGYLLRALVNSLMFLSLTPLAFLVSLSLSALPLRLPALTTLSIPYNQIGQQMATMLLEQIDGNPGGRTVPIPTLIIRGQSA